MVNVALLQGKKVFVTGAARGLGRDFAQAIAEAGAQVVMADILTDLVQQEAAVLQAQGLQVTAVTIDLANADSIQQAVQQAAEHLAGIDGLVNCAALATNVGGKSLMGYDADLWDRVMNINVKGTWLVTKACVPYLKQSDAGKVINVASDTALWGAPNLMAYVASKGALLAMTRSMWIAMMIMYGMAKMPSLWIPVSGKIVMAMAMEIIATHSLTILANGLILIMTV
jgi:NAD(P)-dependent dehydrogenase (short-subunit alcohol dehydrogenase family)